MPLQWNETNLCERAAYCGRCGTETGNASMYITRNGKAKRKTKNTKNCQNEITDDDDDDGAKRINIINSNCL